MKVLILGGAGFIGRYVAQALHHRGHDVLIGTRDPRAAGARLPPGLAAAPRREVHVERLLDAKDWRPLLADLDAVVNCVGILRPRWRESYEQVHNLAVASLADACVAAGVKRLVHVSALGLEGAAASGFIRSKRRGEQALLQRRLDAVIVRPSLLDGAGGFAARWLRRVAQWPLHFVPANATGRMAPLDVDDLGQAIAALCEMPAQNGVRIFELGGSATRTLTEHLAALRRSIHERPAFVVQVPSPIARATSHVCDLLHLTPFSFGHLELLQRANVPQRNALPELLRRAPKFVGEPTVRNVDEYAATTAANMSTR